MASTIEEQTRPGDPIQILLIDDHALFREGLARLLEAEPDFRLVANCTSVDEALRSLSKNQIDVVLLDFDLGLQRGHEFLERARDRGFAGRILIVTAGMSDHDAVEALRLGAAGIFLKHSPTALLAKSIRRVMDGEPWLDARYLGALVEARDKPHRPRSTKFTERETAVLRGVFRGLANKEIADSLKISETSVKAALQQLFEKTGVRTRGQLVRVALEQHRDQL
jgi:two-component system, NarL family, nitrate/nitrite response regulator NarL